MTQTDKEIQYRTFSKFQQRKEQQYSPAIYRALNSQVKDFIHYYKAGVREDYALMMITPEPLIKAIKPLYLDAGVNYGAKVRASIIQQKARMPIGFNERMIQLLTAYFQTDILNVCQGITDTTKELIQAVLTKAIELGEGIDYIVRRLENTEISRSRSRMIARTETVTAANQGAMFAAKDTGLLLKKEWLSTMDDRTRKDHLIINGSIVNMDDYFVLPEGVTMQQPGDRVQKNGLPTPAKEVCNCRCTTVFETVRNASGKLLMA